MAGDPYMVQGIRQCSCGWFLTSVASPHVCIPDPKLPSGLSSQQIEAIAERVAEILEKRHG